MTNLSEIHGINKYCGPGVLSALTGKSTDECASVISQISGKQTIKAVDINHLITACEKLGLVVTKVNLTHGTLYGCLSALVNTNGHYIVGVPKHVVAIEVLDKQIYFIDNHSIQAIPASQSARLTQRVDGIWLVKPKTLEEKRADVIASLNKRIAEVDSTLSYYFNLRADLVRQLKSIT